MKKRHQLVLDDYVGCFGNFNRGNVICRKHCAVNLRCAVEQDQNVRLEVLEDLVISDGYKGGMN